MNTNNKRVVFNKLFFQLNKRIATLIVIGVVLSCSSETDPTPSPNAALEAPQHFTIDTVTSTTVDLKWGAVTGAKSYIVYRDGIAVATNSGTPLATTYSAAGLTASTGYKFLVKACNNFGCSLEAKVDVTTAPDTPDNFTIEAVTSTTVDLKWDTVTGAKSYIVYRDGTAVARNTGSPPTTTYRATGLTANTGYKFSVKACNNFGCSLEAKVDVTTAPDTPDNFTIEAVTSTNVDLKWDTVTGASSYIVYRDGTAVATNTGSPPLTTYRANGLTASTGYKFSVKACNNFGCSLEATVDTTTDPPNIGDLNIKMFASSISTNELTLTFEGEHEYSHFILSQDGIVIAENIPGTKVDYKVTDLSPNKSYTFSLQTCNGATCAPETVKATVITRPMPPREFKLVKAENTATSLSLTWEAPTPRGAVHYNLYQGNKVVAEKVTGLKTSVTGLELGTTYTFDLVACNAANLCSIPAAEKLEFTTAPTSIRNLRVVQINETDVIIQWEGGLGVTSYVLKNGGAEIDDAPEGNVKQFRIRGLAGDKYYTFSLQACNETGCSDPATVTVKTKEIKTAPATPVGLAYTKVTSTTVELDWGPTDRATHYRVFYTNITAGVPQVSNQVYTSEFATGDNALTANTQYKFEVEACNSLGCSSRSTLTVITRPDPPEHFTFVRAENTFTSLSFIWEAPTGGAAYYVLSRGGGVGEKVTGLSKSITGLEPGTPYTFGLVACNVNDLCSLTNIFVITTPPSPVTDLAIKGDPGSTTVTISWTKPKGTTSYEVSKQKDGGAPEVVANSLTADDTEFVIGGLDSQTTYIFSLRACNDAGCSAAVTINGKTVNPPANAPGNH